MINYFKNHALILGICLVGFSSCETENEKPNLRSKIEYSSLVASSPYSGQFLATTGTTTVDLTEGNTSLRMFQSLNYYFTSSIKAKTTIQAQKASNLFSNTGNSFIDITDTGISVSGTALNSSSLSLSEMVAASRSQAEATTTKTNFGLMFSQLEQASLSLNKAATSNTAGMLGTYLVDENGIEIAQVIQKSLIGALQLDYIGNVLLKEGLNADNYSLVEGKNYTKLEHNWDMAYGMLTLNPVYLEGYTDSQRGPLSEFGAGSYIWEYNKESYAKIFPAFLKGRAAIVNNDRAELEIQALFIRKEFEKALANAALGYLGKWRTSTSDDKRAHAIGEGLGFIYSLRFASTYQADAMFSDAILLNLVGGTNDFWNLDASKINAAELAIKAKFGL
ncbi:DUF4856 domain-containing protein [Algoriphagus aquimarinus]|uniref:DUF4856 domain-containing protein n=1 Tax=Algoriphagus aquimarinus TaxID=237018 RepID=A0A5C7AZ31_9BACT|nr:DUF4856 domain-containing protein [Algoriphagus aquimarinus]TXE14100.1 DUF4856 domain-containing protein [Algoriphagus aquimarinus]